MKLRLKALPVSLTLRRICSSYVSSGGLSLLITSPHLHLHKYQHTIAIVSGHTPPSPQVPAHNCHSLRPHAPPPSPQVPAHNCHSPPSISTRPPSISTSTST